MTHSAALPVLLCALTVGVLASGPATPARASTWPAIPESAWSEPARPDSGGKDAMVLLATGEAEDHDQKYSFTCFRRIRIYTEAGREAGKVDIDFPRRETRQVSIEARSVRRDGTVTELAPSQIVNTTLFKSGRVEFARASFVVPGVEPGCIVEYRYTLAGKSEGPWSAPWYFQGRWYTVESRFEWRPDADAAVHGFEPRCVLRHTAESIAGETCSPDCQHPRTVSFALRDLRGTADEDWAPPSQDAGPSVVTTYIPLGATAIDYWSVWKAAFDDLGKEFGKDLGPLSGLLEEARKNGTPPESTLVTLHDWLRRHVRSTEEPSFAEQQAGEADHEPFHRTAAELLASGRGSPFEINLAFAKAAEKLGFDATPILVRDRREGTFDYDLVGWPPTEVITAIRLPNASRHVYFDPASRFALPRNVPWYLRGGPGLAAGGGSRLTVTVDPDAGMAGLDDWHLDLALDGSGAIAGRIEGRLGGESARETRSTLWSEDPNRWSEALAGQLSTDGTPKLVLAVRNLAEAPDSCLELRGTVTYPELATATGSLVSVPVDRLVPWRLHAAFDPAERTSPVFFRYPRRERLVVDLHLPPGAAVPDLPTQRSQESDLGAWSTSYARLADGVSIARTVTLRTAQVSPGRYSEVRELFRGLEQADAEVLLVKVR